MKTLNLSQLTLAITTTLVATSAFSAGLDRSGQDTTAFFQDGTYAELAYVHIEGDVTGEDVAGNDIGNIVEDYQFARFGVKSDLNDTLSVGVLYDEPWGAAAKYTGQNIFIDPTNGEATNVEVRSHTFTGILGAKIGGGKNFQVYGGPVIQRINSDLKLRGPAYGPISGYNSYTSPDTELGWLAGVAYHKPEIALKAALTYRSEIDHDVNIDESNENGPIPVPGASDVEITTPQSVNFDFQTGLNPTTLATANVRWVPWSDFSIVPPKYNAISKSNLQFQPDGLPIVNYSEDQWKVELGLAKRLNQKLAVSGNVGWDSGAGNPVTSLGPVEGYYSTGLGVKYNIDKNWAVSAGGKYLWFGDAEATLPSGNKVGNFEDNSGFIAGVKLSYQAK